MAKDNAVEVNLIFFGHDRCAFDHVFQFPDITGPGIVHEHFQGVTGYIGNLPVGFLAEYGDKMPDQQWDILSSVS